MSEGPWGSTDAFGGATVVVCSADRTCSFGRRKEGRGVWVGAKLDLRGKRITREHTNGYGNGHGYGDDNIGCGNDGMYYRGW